MRASVIGDHIRVVHRIVIGYVRPLAGAVLLLQDNAAGANLGNSFCGVHIKFNDDPAAAERGGIHRCIICGRYFLLKSGVHALYCEGACPHAPDYTCRQFGSVEVQKELAKDIPKVKVKVTAFSRITKDLSRNAISQKDARKAKDYVRDLLYDALRDASISVETFEESVSSENVYQRCGITRTANPRGRPPKAKAGEQA